MDIYTLEQFFELDCDFSKKSFEEYNEALNYYHSKQLPADVESEVLRRNQIPLVENLFKSIVNKILGYKTQSIQEVKVTGRQEQDKPLATLLNDLLKVFSQSENYDKEIIKRDLSLILGMGVIEVFIKECEGDFVIDLKEISPLSFVIDKYSTDKNALDSKRFHKCFNMDFEDAKAIFGDLEYYDDGVIKRSVLIESWVYEKDGFNRYVWQKGNKILKQEEKPFLNGEHPFIVSKYYIDKDGKFYGIFRDIKPLQDYINFAENRMSNMIGSFKAFYEEDAISNKEEFINSASLDNSFTALKVNGLSKIKFIDTKSDIGIITQKVIEKRQIAKILSGINDEVMGLGGTRQSGIAIQQRRDAGLMSLQDYIKCSDDMDKLVFKKVLRLIQKYFTKQQVFKIVDKKTGDRYFSINDKEDNTIKIGQFDLNYTTTLKTLGREERFAHWSEIFKTIASVNPQLVPHLLPLMLKDTESPIVEDIEEVMEAQLAQAQEQLAQAQEQNPIQDQATLLELEKIKAQIQELNAKALKYQAQSQAVLSKE